MSIDHNVVLFAINGKESVDSGLFLLVAQATLEVCVFPSGNPDRVDTLNTWATILSGRTGRHRRYQERWIVVEMVKRRRIG